MNSANSKILNAKTVYSTVKQQAWSAVIAVGALLVTLFLVGSSYFVGIVKSVNAERDIPHDAELRFGLLLGGLLLTLFYLVILAVRHWPLREKAKLKPCSAKQKELQKALTPERYIVAGSALIVVFIGADAYGLPVLGEVTGVLVGIAFVAPLGIVLNEWGDLSEHFEPKRKVKGSTAWADYC